MKNNNIRPEQVGRLEVGTETLVDKSKSTKTVLMQLFQGFHDIEGTTSINACYGATNAILNTLNWASSPSWDGRYGIVVAVDIAVYEEGPARPTGGAGAVAMLIGKNPKIIINLTRGSFIDNEWDFYKPIPSSEYPVVDGKYSMELYLKALNNCCQKLKEKTKRDHILEESSFFCFHCPFAKMVRKAF